MADLTAVIFDYYETLARLPAGSRERVFDEVARRVGLELPPGEAYRHWRELTGPGWTLRLFGTLRPPLDGPTPDFRLFRDVWRERFAALFRHWAVDAPPELGVEAYARAHAGALAFDDARPALDALSGRHRLAVLSDADCDYLEASIRSNGFAFEAVVASEEARAYKPHVSLFREVCGRLGVTPSEALYVGDIPWADVEGARHAGLRAVWLNRHGARWPDDIEPPETTISSLSELPAVLPP